MTYLSGGTPGGFGDIIQLFQRESRGAPGAQRKSGWVWATWVAFSMSVAPLLPEPDVVKLRGMLNCPVALPTATQWHHVFDLFAEGQVFWTAGGLGPHHP